MVNAYYQLVQELPQLFTDFSNPHDPRLVIAIDEAHTLSKIVEGRYQPSHVFYQVIGVFSRTWLEVSNWVLCVSTSFKLADFSALSRICE